LRATVKPEIAGWAKPTSDLHETGRTLNNDTEGKVFFREGVVWRWTLSVGLPTLTGFVRKIPWQRKRNTSTAGNIEFGVRGTGTGLRRKLTQARKK